MKRLIEYTVFSGFVTACRFATCPTSRSPVLVIATTDGVVRAPSWLGITTGSPARLNATHHVVVPSSIPRILLIAAIPPETFCHSVRPYLTETKANPAQFLRSKPSSKRSIHVECMFVKFSDNNYNSILFSNLHYQSAFLSPVRQVTTDDLYQYAIIPLSSWHDASVP